MTYQDILVEQRGRVGLIRLNRPQALNALDSRLNAELGQAVAAFDAMSHNRSAYRYPYRIT